MTIELARHIDGDLVSGLRQHPQLKHWLKAEYPISIGTDDPGVFHTNASKELLLLVRAWDLNRKDLSSIIVQSMEYAFCEESIRDGVKDDIQSLIERLCSP